MIVVGVDGSESSVDALRWAVRQATRSSTSVDAVAVWSYPMMLGYPPPLPADWDPEGEVREVLVRAVDEVQGTEGDCDIHQKVMSGQPGPVLVEAAKDAELLVVGSRGHGLVTGMLLGSVGEYCATHALCPVVIVRHRPDNA